MTENDTMSGPPGDGAADQLLEQIDIAALIAERDSLLDQFTRARADYANLKRRSETDYERAKRDAAERVLKEVLPVLDDLQDGLALIPADEQGGLANGMRLLEQKFQSALQRLGVKRIEALGEAFDPTLHEAVDFDPAGGDRVVAVYRNGYELGGTLLRPAIVKVGPAA